MGARHDNATRTALHAAIRDVTAAYNRLAPAAQVDVGPPTRDGLAAELRAARATGDSGRARAAIRAWRGHWLAMFTVAGGQGR